MHNSDIPGLLLLRHVWRNRFNRITSRLLAVRSRSFIVSSRASRQNSAFKKRPKMLSTNEARNARRGLMKRAEDLLQVGEAIGQDMIVRPPGTYRLRKPCHALANTSGFPSRETLAQGTPGTEEAGTSGAEQSASAGRCVGARFGGV